MSARDTTAAGSRTEAAPPPEGFQSQYAERDGVRLHSVAGGEGQPVVLVHGWPQTWYGWRKVMPLLAQAGYLVVAPDLRGFGDSARSETGYHKVNLAEDLRAIVRSLGLDRPHLVGHDWGVAPVYAYAAMYPEEVASLAVIEAPPIGPWVAEVPSWPDSHAASETWFSLFHRVPGLPEAVTRGREDVYLQYFYDHFASAPGAIPSEDVAEYLRTFRDPAAMRAGFELYRSFEKDLADNLRFSRTKLTMPVLALGGERSWGRVVLESMQALATDVQGGVIEGAAHWIPEENTSELVRRLLEFFTGPEKGSTLPPEWSAMRPANSTLIITGVTGGKL